MSSFLYKKQDKKTKRGHLPGFFAQHFGKKLSKRRGKVYNKPERWSVLSSTDMQKRILVIEEVVGKIGLASGRAQIRSAGWSEVSGLRTTAL